MANPQEPWQTVADLLRNPDGLRRQFPLDSQSSSLLDGLAESQRVAAGSTQAEAAAAIQTSLTALLNQLAVFDSISRCPILAITGMLNAGKSSLLATYLSPSNRRRVLRGLGNDAGTHRFVLWLPSVWRSEAELLSTLIGFLSSLFGHPPEQLSDDPQIANLQYNGRILASELLGAGPQTPDAAGDEAAQSRQLDSLSVPLIAYDDALDELKLGLIDCPDIQTGFYRAASTTSGDALASRRLQQLSRIGRLCSAFIVVSKMSSLHDDGLLSILATLRDAMPGVPRLLAVNKVKARYSPETVYEQARGLVERFGMQAVFAAYDFRSSLADTRVPAMPANMIAEADGSPLPIFFEATPTSGQHRYLHNLGDQLDAGTLSKESSRSLVLQLKHKTIEAIDWFEQNQRQRAQQITDAWQAIADACYEFMAERDSSGRSIGLRLQASPAIIAQMADSLQRTAPAWMRISLSIDRTARQLQQAVANSAARFKILQSASGTVTQFTKRFRRGDGAQVVTPQRLAEAIRSCDAHDALQSCPQSQLVASCEFAMQRFAAEDKTVLNEKELDDWSRQVWRGMSFRDKLWKGTQPLAVMMAPLLAAVLVPIDGGGTAVLVFASAKELLAAAGLAAVMTPMATGGEALSIVHRETPWRQLSDLFAIVGDAIGLPRPAENQLPNSKCNGQVRKLQKSNLEPKRGGHDPAVQVWQLDSQLLTELRLAVQHIG